MTLSFICPISNISNIVMRTSSTGTMVTQAMSLKSKRDGASTMRSLEQNHQQSL